jgi:hypothetical protein
MKKSSLLSLLCIASFLLLLTACSSKAVSPQIIPINSVSEAITQSTAAMEKIGSFQVQYTERSISDEENKKTKYRNHTESKDYTAYDYIDEKQYHLYNTVHQVRSTDEKKYPDNKTEIYVKNGILYKHYFTWNAKEPDRWVQSKSTKSALIDVLSDDPEFLYPTYQLKNLKANQNKVKLSQEKDMYVLNLELTNQKQKATIMGINGNKGLIQLDAIKTITLSKVKILIDKRTLYIQKIEKKEISTTTAENGEVIKKDEQQTYRFNWDKKSITIPKAAATTPDHI